MKNPADGLVVVNAVVPAPRRHQGAAREGAVGGALGGILGAIVGGPVGAFFGAALFAGTGAAIGAKNDEQRASR